MIMPKKCKAEFTFAVKHFYDNQSLTTFCFMGLDCV